MRDPKTLKVFEKADELVLSVYRVTRGMPSEEKFALTNQIRRAAVSVPSNIVEGCSRASQREFGRFIEIALGSAMELEYQLGLAQRVLQDNREHIRALATAPDDSKGRSDFDARTTELRHEFCPVLDQAAEVVKMLISLHQSLWD